MSEKTLEQQAKEWILRRDALKAHRQNSSLVIALPRDVVDPRAVVPPLRGEIERLLGETI